MTPRTDNNPHARAHARFAKLPVCHHTPNRDLPYDYVSLTVPNFRTRQGVVSDDLLRVKAGLPPYHGKCWTISTCFNLHKN